VVALCGPRPEEETENGEAACTLRQHADLPHDYPLIIRNLGHDGEENKIVACSRRERLAALHGGFELPDP